MASVCECLAALIATKKKLENGEEETTIRKQQVELCENLIQGLDTLHSEQQKIADRERKNDTTTTTAAAAAAAKSGNNFIHTRIDYKNKQPIAKKKGFSGRNIKFQDTSVRQVFEDADWDKGTVRDAPPILALLMMDRVETEKLLPPTQDVEANEEVMNNASAIMLTRPALIAAQLYSLLLTIPGAMVSGLIQMDAVTSLAALCRRWRVECVTAVDLLAVSESKSSTNKKPRTKPAKRKTAKRKASKSATTNPIKRGRGSKKRTVVFADDVSTDDNDDDDDNQEEEEETDEEGVDIQSKTGISLSSHDDDDDDTDILLPLDLLLLGLKAALALSAVPMQKEFMSWSSEPREAIMDAVTSLFGTVCALVTPAVRPKLEDRVLNLQELAMNAADSCLMQCIFTAMVPVDDDDAYNSENQGTLSISTKRHETSIFLFRGLYPVMVMRDHLPNGEAGKQIASEKAAETLKGFVRAIKEEMAQENNLWTPRGAGRTKAARAKRSIGRRASKAAAEDLAATPKTAAKKGRKKRVSFGGVMETNGKTPILKSAKKAAAATATTNDEPTCNRTKPRPVLSAVLGLMQKLATTKGLDRANLRSSTVKSLRCSLQHLPTLEQGMMLRFFNRLTRSKVSVHRLTGTELLGHVLIETWLWDDHSDQPISTPEYQPHSQIPTTPPSKTRAVDSPPSSSKSTEAEETPTPSPSQDLDIPTSLVVALIERLVDRAPAVRARVGASLADLFRKVSGAAQLEDSEHFDSLIGLRKCLGSKAYSLTASLRKRALGDDKATVRRTASEALTELMLLGTFDDTFPVAISEEEVHVLGQLCNDNSLLTRKVAAQALTSLLARASALTGHGDSDSIDLVARTWCFSVLPMTLDPESGCVAKAVELVHQVVIMPIVLEDDSDVFDKQTAWRILSLVCESSMTGSSKNLTAALKASITKLTTTDSVYKDITKTLLKRICDVAVRTIDAPDDELFQPHLEAQRSGVWCLFDALVDQTNKLAALYQTLNKLRMDLDFLGSSWEKMLTLLEKPELAKRSADLLRTSMKCCLKLLARMASCVHINIAQKSATNLYSMLEKFTLPPDLIGSAVAALAATCIVCSGEEADVDQVRRDCSGRLKSLYGICETTISSYAKQILDGDSQPSEHGEEASVRALYTIGECAVVGFTPDENETHNKAGKSKGKESSRATEADPLKGLNIPPSKELIELVMAFLPGQLLGSDQTPETARAHAFTAIGKVCMRSGQEELAKKCVTIFAREIKENFNHGCPSVQSNALLVLGDLCCRYTNLVDRYLPVMATCLQSGLDAENSIIVEDKSAVVRKNAILLLSSLLLQDFIKFRGLLFFRFLVACADNDETVAQIGESMLVGPLLSKNPKLFNNNFCEAVFVLNRCKHPIYLAAKSFGDGGAGIAVDFEGINLTGPAGRAKRFHMYELMLSRMSDEQKIEVTARLAKDVLGSAATTSSGALHKVCTNPLTQSDAERASTDRDYQSAFNVLSDTFAILSSPLLKVGKGSQSNDDDQDIIEDPNLPNTSRRIVAAKGKLLSKISRKHLIEIVFPLLCSLKAVLQKSCSPLLGTLMDYFVYIFRGYRAEVKDFLSNDPSLLQEIEYDSKRMSRGGGRTPARGKKARPVSPQDADNDNE